MYRALGLLEEGNRDHTMKVVVRVLATLKEMIGSEVVEMDLPKGADVGDLLKRLSEDYGGDLGNYIIDDRTGTIRPYLQIVVDGRYTSSSSGSGIELRDGSVVSILPPIGGG